MGGRHGGRRRAGHAPPVLALVAAVLALLNVSAGGSHGADRAQVRPNILVIMTDDETVENVRVMANVQRLLVDRGTTFDNFFTSFPLCCPSRATFLTGQYSHNTHVVGNSLINGLANLDERNVLPVWLQRAGYSTFFIGKYLNGYRELEGRKIPPGWNEWYAGLRLSYFNHTMLRNGTVVQYGSKPSDYQTDVYTRTALDVLRRHSADSKPFFMWLSYWAPHFGSPREPGDPPNLHTPVAAPRDRGAFANEPLPRPPSFDEVDVSDKPAAIQALPPLSQQQIDALTSSYRRRLASLLAVDDGIAQVIDELRASGKLDRTLIFFTSDNGFLQGEHRIPDGKVLLYEPSIRVPLIVRGPGVPPNLHLHQLTANVDLAPTIVAAAHASTRRPEDGRSLLPLFGDRGLEWGRDILLERGPGPSGSGPPLYTAIRTPRYVYAEHAGGERELYDLVSDPDELQSLHADPAYGSVMAELAGRLAQLRSCAGATCLLGPRLALEPIADASGCAQEVRLTGADEEHVTMVDFVVNGNFALRADTPPFEAHLAAAGSLGESTPVRALAVLDDGRQQTLDLAVQTCR